mgnify:FL=1
MTLCYFWLIVFPGFQIYSILYTIYIPKQEIPENYLANRKTKNNTQLQEEWIRRKYVVPVNIMESENNLIVENAIGGKNYYLFWNKNSRQGIFAEINSVDPNIVPMLIVRGMSQDICVEWWEVMLIKARCEYLENQGQIVQDPLKRLNEQLNENDNPVIILNYLKKDRFWDSGTDLSSRNPYFRTLFNSKYK